MDRQPKNSPESIAQLRARMPILRKLAVKMHREGKITEERKNLVCSVSATGFAHLLMKEEHPEVNWEAWENQK